MLPPYIIDEIRKRENEREKENQPAVEVPVPPVSPRKGKSVEPSDDRGVVVIDLM